MRKAMYYRKLMSVAVALLMALAAVWAVSATPKTKDENEQRGLQAIEPLNIAILIQDDLVPQGSNEIGVARDFICLLPQRSHVMVGYITAGTLQVRQPFTTDLDKAARSLRIPTASTASTPFNPYVEVLEALRQFDKNGTNANAILLISDGLDTSRFFDSPPAVHTLDIEGTISKPNNRGFSIFIFYAPSVGLRSRSRIAASYGQ